MQIFHLDIFNIPDYVQEPILYELVEKRPWSPKKYEFVEKRPWSPGKRNYDWARLSKRADTANYEGKYVYKTTSTYLYTEFKWFIK